jgi:glycosyltransferase involved in cell wall biosynthesis
MDTPLVTIGCAVYNGEKTLERALSSVVAQDYPNIEILISDDGSTDRSREIYENFARRDPRIRIIRNTANLGVTRNFNNLVTQSAGKYFMWADQDDIREKTFVRKAVAVLEADPGAVICHSHTGAFVGDARDIKFVITLDRVAGVRPRVVRYWKFLRYYSDTVLYGLIRADALRVTRLYRHTLGSANALLFELLLLGTFVQIPEVLSYYSGRGLRNRPSAKQEYARANPGRQMPWWYFPFMALALNQATDIQNSVLAWPEKVVLLCVLWSHVFMVFVTKLVYRVMARASFDHLPDWFTRACDFVVEPRSHLVFLNNSDRDEELFPKAWALKGKS